MKPETPITDAEAGRAYEFFYGTEVVNADTARKLELDRKALMTTTRKSLKSAQFDSATNCYTVPFEQMRDMRAALTSARANFPEQP